MHARIYALCCTAASARHTDARRTSVGQQTKLVDLLYQVTSCTSPAAMNLQMSEQVSAMVPQYAVV
jgi:hypothetical protein